MSKSQKNLSQNCKKFNFLVEGLDCEARTIDWINTLQFAIKAVTDDASLPESTRLARAKEMAEISIHLANEARDGVWAYIDGLEAWKSERDKPTTKAISPSGGRHE